VAGVNGVNGEYVVGKLGGGLPPSLTRRWMSGDGCQC
jgi:hypothetical protein